MNNFIFENATKTFFGRGCVKEYLACLCSHYGKNVMFAYGGGSVKENGIYEEVMVSLERAGKHVTEFSGIMENPTYQKVLEGALLAKEKEVDFILGVGGGSVMDCCKAIAMAVVYEGDIWENFWARPGIMCFEPLPVGVVVTAAGSGSEMDGMAVITNEASGTKTGRDYPKCNPKFALMDPAYTLSVPKRQMVSGSFGTLSHIMETYLSGTGEDNVSDDIAEALMRNVVRNLRAAVEAPQDYNARSNLMWDASMAKNRVIKLGKSPDFKCHPLAHQLCVAAGCKYGEALAVLLPVYYRQICQGESGKFARFAKEIWGICPQGRTQEEVALAGVEALADFVREIGLPSRLRELGVQEGADWGRIADSCVTVPCSCHAMGREQMVEILRESF